MSLPEPLFTENFVEAARVLFARPAVFMMGAAKMDGLPAPDLPEIAFAGRSNVGKSSLINGLVGQNHLARASNEPGRTREVNFFVLDDKIRLVDLPGYGFAKASKTTTKDFQNLGRDVLQDSAAGKRRIERQFRNGVAQRLAQLSLPKGGFQQLCQPMPPTTARAALFALALFFDHDRHIQPRHGPDVR